MARTVNHARCAPPDFLDQHVLAEAPRRNGAPSHRRSEPFHQQGEYKNGDAAQHQQPEQHEERLPQHVKCFECFGNRNFSGDAHSILRQP